MAFKPLIRRRGRGKKIQPPTTQVFTAPAPRDGIDARTPLQGGKASNCLYTYNLVPDEHGLKVRNGYQEWQTGVGSEVRTIIPFKGSNVAEDRLFVATDSGIYDCTVRAGTPKSMIAPSEWADIGADSGWGCYINYVTEAGEAVVFYADSRNGLFVYEEVTGAFKRPAITGVNVGAINFIVSHKLRIWICVQDDPNGYYLDKKGVQGVATKFNFGNKFKHGGYLKGLFNWTVDGGTGVDDHLVAISSSGDILPYKGADPSDATTWGIVGSYFIGTTVKGVRCASQQGGNLHILSSYGIVSMSDVLRGVDPRTNSDVALTSKISPMLRHRIASSINEQGWSVVNLASEGILAIVAPRRSDGVNIEYVLDLATGAWGMWRDIPLNCVDSWHEAPYIGTRDGRVLVMKGDKDDIKLVSVAGERNGLNIDFSTLFNYSSLNQDGVFKRGVMIRPDFSSKSAVSVETKFLYDFTMVELLDTPSQPLPAKSGWDISLWDKAVWDSSVADTHTSIHGGLGMGRNVSIALRGNAVAGTVLASVDVFFNVGGVL